MLLNYKEDGYYKLPLVRTRDEMQNIKVNDVVKIASTSSAKRYRGASGQVTHIFWDLKSDQCHYIVAFRDGTKAVFNARDFVFESVSPPNWGYTLGTD